VRIFVRKNENDEYEESERDVIKIFSGHFFRNVLLFVSHRSFPRV